MKYKNAWDCLSVTIGQTENFVKFCGLNTLKDTFLIRLISREL